MEDNKIYLRKILLDTMDTYIRDVIGDEDAIDAWLTLGVPDGYTDNDLTEIAEDTTNFMYIINTFKNLIYAYEED